MSKLKDLLEEHSANEQAILTTAAPLYAKRNELVKQLLPMFIKKNPDGIIDGVLQTPITIKFKDGKIFTLKPNYMSATGEFKGAIFKNYGVELFTITEKGSKKG